MKADAVARQDQIVNAVLEVAATRGIESVSVRLVAAAAGVSAGMVQHYFRTRDEMLIFACSRLVERTGERTAAIIGALPDGSHPRTILRETFRQMLPLDDERKAGVRIWIAFLARATVQPDLEEFMRNRHTLTHAYLSSVLQRAQDDGLVGEDLNIEQATVDLFSQVDGLVSHVMIGHYTGNQAMQTIETALDRVFGPDR